MSVTGAPWPGDEWAFVDHEEPLDGPDEDHDDDLQGIHLLAIGTVCMIAILSFATVLFVQVTA